MTRDLTRHTLQICFAGHGHQPAELNGTTDIPAFVRIIGGRLDVIDSCRALSDVQCEGVKTPPMISRRGRRRVPISQSTLSTISKVGVSTRMLFAGQPHGRTSKMQGSDATTFRVRQYSEEIVEVEKGKKA